MTTQIAVRLPDEMVEYIDQQIAAGKAKSRAAFLTSAAERERRRQRAERDAGIYASTGPDPAIEEWNTWAESQRDWSHLD
jgi:Arc/MetJ-type ribon-helix-helix transcriptional regulator